MAKFTAGKGEGGSVSLGTTSTKRKWPAHAIDGGNMARRRHRQAVGTTSSNWQLVPCVSVVVCACVALVATCNCVANLATSSADFCVDF